MASQTDSHFVFEEHKKSIYCARSDVWRELGIVVPELKLVYFSMPRAANTAIKLSIDAALGHDASRFVESEWSHATAAAGVHNSRLVSWASIRDFGGLPPGIREEDRKEWFLFTSVRHPLSRLFSSWVLFLLLKEPHLATMEIETEYPMLPRERSEIPSMFEEFLWGTAIESLMQRDVHFAPQVDLLPRGVYKENEIKVYRVDAMSDLASDINAHLRRSGIELIFDLQWHNEGVLKLSDFDWNPEVQQRCFELYERDYRAFGFEVHVDHPPYEPALDRTFVTLLRGMRERHERIEHLAKALRTSLNEGG